MDTITAPFSIFKKGLERTLRSPLVADPVSVAEYVSISLNILKYHWKCLNKQFELCQGSQYVQSSYMLHRVVTIRRVLKVQGFWICHGCICKGYTEFWICLNMTHMPQQCLNMPQYTLLSLDMSEHGWILLIVPEYAWINCSHYARDLNMQGSPMWLRCYICQGPEYDSI